MTTTSKWAAVTLAAMIVAGFWVSRRSEIEHATGPVLSPGKVAPQIAMTWDSAALLAPDGSLWAWGGSQFGLLCIFSNQTVTPVPIRVGRESDWSRVALGIHFALAVKLDGSLWGWGSNAEGALASAPSHVFQPWRIDDANDWIDVRAGASHVMAMKRDGSLWIWGQNTNGQIGDGTTNTCRKPLAVVTRHRWKAFAPGFFNSYAIAGDGTLWGWGFSYLGGTGGTNRLAPVEMEPGAKWVSLSAGDYTLVAVREDGTLWAGGQNLRNFLGRQAAGVRTNEMVQIGSGTNWSEVWVGQNEFLVRKKNGSWWANNTSPGILFQDAVKDSGDESDMRRFSGDFDPWTMSVGMGTTAILLRDGVLRTTGERLGERGKITLLHRLEMLISRLRGSPSGIQPRPMVDNRPRAIWQMPSTNVVTVER